MLHTLTSAEQAAVNTCNPESPLRNLSGTALRLYEALREVAVEVGAARGYVANVTHVTLHIPVEVVGVALGRHRVTIWRAARQLRALGLVDARAHKTTALGGRVVNDGTLWCVRLDPDEGTAARLTFDDLKHGGWRDLDRDRRRGRTAHRVVKEHREQMQQSKANSPDDFDKDLLLEWSLPPQRSKNPVIPDCCTAVRADLESVLDVRFVARDDRAGAVYTAAQALAGGLGDAGSVRFYQWLIWRLLRLSDSGRDAPWMMVYEQARRARADAGEGFARKPGALFVSRLKRASWWDELARAAGPVGSRPVN